MGEEEWIYQGLTRSDNQEEKWIIMMEMDLPIKRLRRSMSQITQGPVRVEYLYDMDGM